MPPSEALAGLFGLVHRWAQDTKITRHTYNARSENVDEKPSFRDAWRKGQRCIIPAEAYFEPDWRSGQAVPTKIMRTDGEPMEIAGLWSWWKSPNGETTFSFTMLTIIAADQWLMNRFHKATDEKRMVVVLPDSAYGAWLDAPVESQPELLRPYAAELLAAQAVERTP